MSVPNQVMSEIITLKSNIKNNNYSTTTKE